MLMLRGSKAVGTASEDSKLIQLGETEEFKIWLKGLEATWVG